MNLWHQKLEKTKKMIKKNRNDLSMENKRVLKEKQTNK